MTGVVYLPESIAALRLQGSKMPLPAMEEIFNLTQKKAGTLNSEQELNFSDQLGLK
jgi:hypothetical protein